MTHPKNAMRKLRRAAVTTAVAAGLLATGLPALMTSASADDLLPYQDQSLPFSARAADLVSRLTMEEKAQQFFTGIFNATAGANSSSQAPAIPRLGIPSYNYWNEALHGVARRGNATEFPTGLGIASTWNRDLVYSFTEAASDEARDKTNDCLNSLDMTTADGLNRWCEGLTYWSPTINLNRDPRWGRADESYGEDPYIAGEIAGQFAQGLQGGRNQSLPDSVGGTPTSYLKAISTPKHYLANNSEVNRHSGTSNLSDRSLHEYYTAQFGKAAGAEYGAKSFMTSYNAINIDPNYTSKTWGPPTVATVVNDKGGTPVPANKYAVETIMRRLYGFDGFVTSDCGAVQDVWEQDPSGHSWNPTELGRQVTEAEGDAYSVKAGTDMDCTVSWTGSTYPKGLPAAQTQGLATEQDWDVALTRAFTIRFQTGEFDDADKVPYRGAEYTQNGTQEEAVGSPQHSAIAHQMSLESPVLLKNTGNALPLSVTSGGNTVVLGYYATHPIHGGYSPSQPPIVTQTAASQIAAYVGAQGGTTTVIDNAIVPAVGVKPSVARLEAWASGSTPPATGNETAANPSLGYRLANTFTPDGIGWEIRSNFSGVPTFYARDTMSGTFTVENFDIPATANLLRLNISGTDLLDKLDATDPNCVSAGAPDVGCPTIASFGVTINGVTRTYPVNRQAYTNQTTSAAAETYMPMIIPLADFSGVAGTTVDVQFSFSVALPGGGGSTGVNLSAADQTAIQNAENVIVYVGTREADSNEEVDRPVIDLPRFQADLVNAAIALNPNTVVYMQSVGQVNITPFKDAAKAIIWTTYNGQYQGQAAAELLFAQNVTLEDGRQVRANPSGHLTWTFYSDVDAQLGTTANGASKDYSLSKAEGSLCGRTYWYYQSGTTGCAAPDFPFGHGLSYSTFTYSNVALSKATASPDDTVNITATVTNTGSIPGREVVQVYASSPQADGNARPYKQVKGFEKTGVLEPNASETVTIPLKASDLWFWDTATQKRVYDQGTWKILVGPSSDSARGTTLDLAISGAITGGVDVVAAVPDGVALNTATPGNVINANVSATKHDQSFWDLASSAVKVEYSSGDRSVATVNSSGVVSPVGAGATLITVKVTADGETESTTFPVAVHEGRPTAGVTNWTSPSHVAGTYTALPAHTAYNFMVNFANQNVTLDQAKAGVQLKAGATTPDIVGYEYLIAPMDLNEIGATITPDGVLTATKTGQVQVTVVVESDQKISRHALITVVNSAAQVPGDSAKLGPIVSAASVLTAGPFSPESWSALQTALANAKAVAADKTAPQSRIDAAAAALNAALAGLKPVPAKATEQPGGITAAEAQRQADVAAAAAAAAATKTALAAVTADAEALVAKAGAYTPASVQAVQAALATAKTVGANPAATPAEVQAALTALSKAVAGLVPAPATVKAGTVKITGTAKVGKTLKAKVAKWTKGTAYSYRWYAGSKVIKNATGASLKITKALKGKKIKVRVTGTKSGLVSSIKTSKATKKIK